MERDLQTKKCVVAFIDILGTSEAIKNDENNTNLNTMNYILQTAFEMCYECSDKPDNIQVKAFSDNIVFSIEIPEELSELEQMKKVHDLIEICAYFQIAAFGMGVTLRGGITIGDYFCNDIFVWGKALLRAYTLENKVAIYPRIVFDENVIDLLPECDTDGNKHHLKIGDDGIAFLDYLSFFTLPTRNEYIKRCFDDIERIIKCLKNDERAIQKIRWLKHYLKNGFVEDSYNDK